MDVRRRRIEAMIRTLLCATLVLGSCVGVLLAADAFTGSWKLDLAKSTFASDNPPPKELTLTFSEQGDTSTEMRTRLNADGRATSTSWTAPITGGIVTFPAGQGPNGGASVKLVDDKALLMTQNLRTGKPGASRTYQISADGQTLTLTQIREDGQETARMVLSRQ
jgi:hypothetical protein